MAFLDYSGLSHFLDKCKTIFASKSAATQSADGLMSSADKTKLDGVATGATANIGTVTSVKINGSTKNPTSGVVDLGGTYLTSHRENKVNGITTASGTINNFGTCGTAAATAAKTVSITTGTFSLEAGTTISVKFTNANTANNPTLAVNSTAAKNIFVNGSQITTGGNKGLLAGTVNFIYDGTQWNLIGNYYDTNTQTVTGVKGNSESSYRTGNVNITAANVGAAPSSTVSCTATNIKSALQTTTGTTKYFREDGTWNVPPGAKPYAVSLGEITNTSGSYSHTFTTANVRDDMKPICVEVSDPDVFKDAITVSTGDGTITVSCDNMSGTSDITVTIMESASSETGIPEQIFPASTEYNTLAERIGNLNNLTTTAKTSLVSAANELNSKIGQLPPMLDNSCIIAATLIDSQLGDVRKTGYIPTDGCYKLMIEGTYGLIRIGTIDSIVLDNPETNAFRQTVVVWLKAGTKYVIGGYNGASKAYIYRIA